MHTNSKYPLLPLRDIVVYPKMIVPLFVGRTKSINALQSVAEGDQTVVLVTQKDPSVEDPTSEDIFKVGTLGTILQLLKLPEVGSSTDGSFWVTNTTVWSPSATL